MTLAKDQLGLFALSQGEETRAIGLAFGGGGVVWKEDMTRFKVGLS